MEVKEEIAKVKAETAKVEAEIDEAVQKAGKQVGVICRVLRRIGHVIGCVVRAIYATIMVVVDFILMIHSEESGASWKRWIGSALASCAVFGTWYGLRHNLLTGSLLADIIKTSLGSIAVIYGAGAIASGIAANGGSVTSAMFSAVNKFKSYFSKK